MPIYAIFLCAFGLTAVLFMWNWIRVSKELKKSKQDKINGDLQTTREIKALNKCIDTIVEIVEKDGDVKLTPELLNTNTYPVRVIKMVLKVYKNFESKYEAIKEKNTQLSWDLSESNRQFDEMKELHDSIQGEKTQLEIDLLDAKQAKKNAEKQYNNLKEHHDKESDANAKVIVDLKSKLKSEITMKARYRKQLITAWLLREVLSTKKSKKWNSGK